MYGTVPIRLNRSKQAVVSGDDVGVGGNPADIAVRVFERSLPVLVPGVVGVEVAGQEFLLAQHDPVIDGLRPNHTSRIENHQLVAVGRLG